MPRHAAELECSTEDKASLVALTKSGTAEARIVERARIVLACLEGKEIQQVPEERRKPRDRAIGDRDGSGKAAGEDGWEERGNQMSKGGEEDQFHE